MMVKNEAAYVVAALRSIKDHIDHWVIVDTGSTDDTIALIQEEMKDIPGRIIKEIWRNWGTNRTAALQYAKESGCDFTFIMDADERYFPQGSGALHDYTNPNTSYWISVHFGNFRYSRPNLIPNNLTWEYHGITHEYLAAREPNTRIELGSYLETDGRRLSKTSERCAKDAIMLEEALKENPFDSRNMFYLAQSYRDSGQTDKAITTYLRRTGMGGWVEEIWYSLLQIAALKSANRTIPEAEVVAAFLQAYEARPTRAESLGMLARYLRLQNKYATATLFAEKAVSIPYPTEDYLFIDTAWYEWMALDEYAISSYWTGLYKESLAANDKLLSLNIPIVEIERIIKNREFAVSALRSK